MAFASMYDPPRNAWYSLRHDITKALKVRKLHLTCGDLPDECQCGGHYYALRGFGNLARSIFSHWINPVNKLDRLLLHNHFSAEGAVARVALKSQQQYEPFLWDREYQRAGFCLSCGRGKFTYRRDNTGSYGLCSFCDKETKLR